MNLLTLEVAFAAPEQQVVIPLQVPVNTTILDAIKLSGIMAVFPEIELENLAVGVFSKKKALDDKVQAGDRIEIYRELTIDPKQKRRLLAEKGKTK